MTAHELALEMETYTRAFKKKPKAEREAIAKEHLIRSGLIDENGEFTDHYAYSRDYYKAKESGKAK
ncbi:MAG: hypothetical protein LBS85_04850 [Clostridiales Family XIII bacterium]|jgi:hypothetical protein|nr:hypothetical protein [Clostridiales Family XIII bacterium]